MGLLCREVYLNRLCAIRVDVTEDNLLLIPSVARRGGISRGGARGIHSARGAGAGSIRRSRCRSRGGARRSRGAHAGGTRSACGCSSGIGRTCGGARRIRGGIRRTRGGIRRARGASSGAGGIRCSRGARARCGASSSRGACAGGARSGGARSGGARSRTSGGARRIRGGGIIAYAEGVSVIQVGFLRGRAHRYRVLAFVAEGDLLLATSLLCRKGHGYH